MFNSLLTLKLHSIPDTNGLFILFRRHRDDHVKRKSHDQADSPASYKEYAPPPRREESNDEYYHKQKTTTTHHRPSVTTRPVATVAPQPRHVSNQIQNTNIVIYVFFRSTLFFTQTHPFFFTFPF
jgi:hypothetical protein